MENSRQAADPEWKQLLRLGEQLIDQPTPAAQCDLIAEVVSHLLSAQVRVWLASPMYPLPGAPAMETLPDSPATPLAHQALAEGAIQLSKAEGTADRATQGDGITFSDDAPTTVALPLRVNGTVLGVVQADRPAGPPYNERELSLLEGLVKHAAVAMEVTRLVLLKDWRNEQLALVRSVSAQIASLPNLDNTYDQVARLIQETFQYYYVAIFTLEESTGILRYRGSASLTGSKPLEPSFTVPLGQGIIGTVGQSGAEIVAPDVQQEPRYRYLDALPETLSEASLPLKVENAVLGVLDFQSDQINGFHERDMLVLRSLADNIALAIESKRLYTSLERRAEQISSVFEVSHALTSILDLNELLGQVVRLIQNRFGYPFVHVYTVHPGRRMVIYQAGTGTRSSIMQEEGRHYSLNAPKGMISWVARNGRTFVVNDVSKEPMYLPSDVPPEDTRSELTVPLMVGNEVLGVLDIQSRSTYAFDENDRTLFEALAAPIAVAMRNANLYRSEQWRRQVAESFRDVAHSISSNLPLNQLMDFILEKLEILLPCDASAIWLIQEDTLEPGENNTPHLRLAATRNIQVDKIFEVLQERQVLDMIDRALKSNQPLIRQPDDPLGPLGAALEFAPNYSSIAAPMMNNERVLGLLTLAHHQDGRYGSEAQAITGTFASYTAVAIQNARLYSESQEQALISTMLLQVSEASQSTMNVEDLLSTMVRLTRLLMGVKKCAFLLWDEGSQNFALKAWYGFEPAGENSYRFSPGLPALTRILADRALLYLDDPEIELNFPEMRLDSGTGTIILLPLMVRREVIGAFAVGLQTGRTAGIEAGFDPKALAILQGIAHQTSLTIDNLRLLEARQEEAYVTAALLQVAQAVVSSNDLNDTLDTIVHLLPILVGVETCVIYLWDAASKLMRPTQAAGQSRREEELILAHPFAQGAHNLLDTIRQSGEMHMSQIQDPNQPFEEWGQLAALPYDELAEQSPPLYGDWVLGYPLSLQDQTLGVLLVRETNASPAFWERRLEIIHGICQQATLALQNDILKQEMVETERIEREIRLARQIQETFLPESLPELPRWEVDLRWETAREIGGDFYDVFRLGENHLALVIADVADKGLPAALYMTVARTLIRAGAVNGASPARVLEEVNGLLVNDSSDSMFITVVYAILNLETGELQYANAGHNRPLLYRYQTANVEQLPKGGTALGILNDLTIEDHIIQIQPGDALTLYTDGVTDLQSPEGDFFGEPRLVEVLQTHGKERVHDMLEALDDALIDFRRGARPADDVTLVAIRRAPAQRTRKRKLTQSASAPQVEKTSQQAAPGDQVAPKNLAGNQ